MNCSETVLLSWSLTLFSFFLGHRMVYADCQEMNTSFPQNVSLQEAESMGDTVYSPVLHFRVVYFLPAL